MGWKVYKSQYKLCLNRCQYHVPCVTRNIPLDWNGVWSSSRASIQWQHLQGVGQNCKPPMYRHFVFRGHNGSSIALHSFLHALTVSLYTRNFSNITWNFHVFTVFVCSFQHRETNVPNRICNHAYCILSPYHVSCLSVINMGWNGNGQLFRSYFTTFAFMIRTDRPHP